MLKKIFFYISYIFSRTLGECLRIKKILIVQLKTKKKKIKKKLTSVKIDLIHKQYINEWIQKNKWVKLDTTTVEEPIALAFPFFSLSTLWAQKGIFFFLFTAEREKEKETPDAKGLHGIARIFLRKHGLRQYCRTLLLSVYIEDTPCTPLVFTMHTRGNDRAQDRRTATCIKYDLMWLISNICAC